MGLIKASTFRAIQRANTRKSKRKSKSYVKAIPPLKIAKFNMGDTAGYNAGKYKFIFSFVSDKAMQIRDNALESTRQLLNRHFEKKNKGGYYLQLSVYPHHILRAHKMLTGAGADRMQSGMKHSFGKPDRIAVQLRDGQEIFRAACNKENLPLMRQIFDMAKKKLPGTQSLIVTENK